MSDTVRVTGLKELRLELKALDSQWPKELQKVNKKIAEKVAEGTKSALSGLGGSAPKVVPTVKALAQQARAQVKVGGGNSIGGQVAMGNLFGSAGRYPQFPPAIDGGYGMYPTIKAMRGEIIELYGDMIEELTRRAFPD